ncbi:C40 family peptidase [Paenibacillus thiaminolyticus]|uniref:C40 family peptidase n=1 Tax=Paenibacillus thiaminolyticus TaxID=49283 RepID=UPI003D2CDD92
MKKIILSIVAAAVLLGPLSSRTYAANDITLNTSVNKVVGTPYVWGGTTTEGFDCSGFIQYIFKELGVKLPRTTKEQAKEGIKIEKEELRAGDIVFFNTDGKSISHAGIYMGDGLFGHASVNKGAEISELSETYYATRYVTARRILSDDQYRKLTINP